MIGSCSGDPDREWPQLARRRRVIVYVCVFSCRKVIDVHAWREPFLSCTGVRVFKGRAPCTRPRTGSSGVKLFWEGEEMIIMVALDDFVMVYSVGILRRDGAEGVTLLDWL